MKKVITFFLLAIGLQTFAQSYSDGIYNTNFGTINLTFEQGAEYPAGGLVYGDYKGIGTITGTTTNNAKEISGSFHNGASEGKFIFFAPSGKKNFFDSGITSFSGNWGYDTDNKYSTNNDFKWGANGKTAGAEAIKNVTNVWSGKWNTTQGYIILQQVGNKVTGKYHNVGNIDAVYNPATKKLSGTFTNNGQKGYLEYTFEGNNFKGKWGWTTAMTGGNWNGEKHIKNNKPITATAATTTANANPASGTAATTNNPQATIKIRVRAVFAISASNSIVTSPDLYGFAGFELKKITQAKTEDVISFGNKSKYIFETTENAPLTKDKIAYNFPDQPSYYRDYIISKADWESPNISFEVVVFHHLRTKEHGQINGNCGYRKETYNLKNFNFNKDHKTPNTDTRVCYFVFKVEKL